MQELTLSWDAIQPLDGTRDKGFEELCAQLARYEIPSNIQFIRKGTPDGGVECYAIFDDGTEWGWQAKYFTRSMDKSQWRQVDDSVETALEKHPRLTRYYVCVAHDRPDARIKGQTSALGKWESHVAKWQKQAKTLGMDVEFIWWGSSELMDRLTQPQHVGRLRFWFGQHRLDHAWFVHQCEKAIHAAGPRYTPELHVELPIALRFEEVGRTPFMFDSVKSKANSIRDTYQAVQHYIDSLPALTTWNVLVQNMTRVFEHFDDLTHDPSTACVLSPLIGTLVQSTQDVQSLINDYRTAVEHINTLEEEESSSQKRDREHLLHSINRLMWGLQNTTEELERVQAGADSALTILVGDAGQGKTHLFCDVAKARLAHEQPTVLLMGQTLTSDADPWTQIREQLGLSDLSLPDFVGMLEAAAQAYGQRAILFIDAINEGRGRTIWPDHLASFLHDFESTSWVSVVLSVRTPYLDRLVPEHVRQQAQQIHHYGFNEFHEEAMNVFFEHYGLEVPSTPSFLPEFRHPLFLKTLCKGLEASEERRLPRGMQGISRIFTLYTQAINKQLAGALGYQPRTNLVRRALSSYMHEMVNKEHRQWLSLEDATRVIDAHLPNRMFADSLYKGLIDEGVLIEFPTTEEKYCVHIAYERLADHLEAQELLRDDTPAADWEGMLKGDSLLARRVRDSALNGGVLEALCIQVAEMHAHELCDLAPVLREEYEFGDAFLRSLVWREPSACFERTIEIVTRCLTADVVAHDVLETLLTLAIMPEHPLNALFLHTQLCAFQMAERDGWWSTFLHHSWERQQMAYRIVEWAYRLPIDHNLEEDVVDLCALMLAWMCTSSHRHLRDRATSAMVNLLTNRLERVIHLVDQTCQIDDLYVFERVCAVAYGVSMRSTSAEGVSALAKCIHHRVFEGTPPAHILLRDYARGVIERALHLDPALELDPDSFRPPYRSERPDIPSEECIAERYAGLEDGDYREDSAQWAENRIYYSVTSDDFARYVIGTRLKWLTHRLDQPRWVRPPSYHELESELEDHLNDEEQQAWQEYKEVDQEHWMILSPLYPYLWVSRDTGNCPPTLSTQCLNLRANPVPIGRCKSETDFCEAPARSIIISDGMTGHERRVEVPDNFDAPPCEEHHEGFLWQNNTCISNICLTEVAYRVLVAIEQRELRREALLAVLTEENQEFFNAWQNWSQPEEPPFFDVHDVQRFILGRVFDYGWSKTLHGSFDHDVSVHGRGRETSKPERIGKKYQWLAFHEILALMSDHYQYNSEREPGPDPTPTPTYQGTWQTSYRDIDPSCTLRALPGGEMREDVASWWTPSINFRPERHDNLESWVRDVNDLSGGEHFLRMLHPESREEWWSGGGFYRWKQSTPPNQRSSDVDRADLWHILTGYLIATKDVHAFMKWSESKDFYGRWMPEEPDIHGMFLGEHVWSRACAYFQDPWFHDEGWTSPQDCPVKIQVLGWECSREASGFDCAIDETYTLRIPSPPIAQLLNLQWAGARADFVDANQRRVVFDPSAQEAGPGALVIHSSVVTSLQEQGYTLCWALVGEKQILSSRRMPYPRIRMSGAYALSEQGLEGFVKRTLCTYGDEGLDKEMPLNTYRYVEAEE